jgi:hypothetical protein
MSKRKKEGQPGSGWPSGREGSEKHNTILSG